TDVDLEKFKLKISEKFVNSLLSFFAIERDIIPMSIFVYGKINTLMRLKKQMTNEEIQNLIKGHGIDLDKKEIHEIMTQFEELGLIKIDPSDPRVYIHQERLTLTAEQQNIMDRGFIPFVDWTINTWRTMFNVRELNTPISTTYPNHEFLAYIVSNAATQGFTHAHFCIKELKNYFQKLME
ncbi:MAG: hypothetical protein ACTSRA_21270, partial [Promethearchaeota archaeon]